MNFPNLNQSEPKILRNYITWAKWITGRLGSSLALLLIPIAAVQADVVLTTTSDGDLTLDGSDVNTTDEMLTTVGMGTTARNFILEFDLGSIADGSAIESATLALVRDGIFTFSDQSLAFDAYIGDGIVDINDATAVGTRVGDFTISSSPEDGDELLFDLTNLIPLQNALDSPDQLLTIRAETDSFATLNFASLETTNGFAPPELRIGLSAVPEPSAAMLLFGVMAVVGLRRRRNARHSIA